MAEGEWSGEEQSLGIPMEALFRGFLGFASYLRFYSVRQFRRVTVPY